MRGFEKAHGQRWLEKEKGSKQSDWLRKMEGGFVALGIDQKTPELGEAAIERTTRPSLRSLCLATPFAQWGASTPPPNFERVWAASKQQTSSRWAPVGPDFSVSRVTVWPPKPQLVPTGGGKNWTGEKLGG